MSKAAKQKPVEDLTFEEAYAELEALVASLEAEQLPLEESLSLFARGQALAKHCAALLESASLRVQQMVGESLTAFTEEA